MQGVFQVEVLVFSFIMRREGVVTKRIRRSLKRGEGGELGARRDGRADVWERCCGRDAETPTATRLCGDADKSQKRTSRFFARTHIKANFELQRRYNKVYTLYGTHDGTLPFRKPVNNCALMRSYSPLITHQYSATSKMFMS